MYIHTSSNKQIRNQETHPRVMATPFSAIKLSSSRKEKLWRVPGDFLWSTKTKVAQSKVIEVDRYVVHGFAVMWSHFWHKEDGYSIIVEVTCSGVCDCNRRDAVGFVEEAPDNVTGYTVRSFDIARVPIDGVEVMSDSVSEQEKRKCIYLVRHRTLAYDITCAHYADSS